MQVLSALVPARRAKVQVALDEGGLRCAWKTGKGYVPFEALADAQLRRSPLGPAKLVLVAKGGDELALALAEDPVAVHREIVARLVGEVEAPETPPLAREARALETWLDDVARRAEAGGYRDPGVDLDALAAILANEHAGAEPRAAAAFVLVGAAGGEILRAVARTFALHALPPLVLLAAWLAPGGEALVPREVVDEVKGYLSREDAALAGRQRPRADPERAPLIAAALREVTEEAILAARAASATPHAKRRRLQPHANALDGTRWVGRTWNI
jgi:hypothetical protein